jgi:hypothetical protein
VRHKYSAEHKEAKAQIKTLLAHNTELSEELSTLKARSDQKLEALQGDVHNLLMTDGSLDERFRPYLNADGDFDFRQENDRG